LRCCRCRKGEEKDAPEGRNKDDAAKVGAGFYFTPRRSKKDQSNRSPTHEPSLLGSGAKSGHLGEAMTKKKVPSHVLKSRCRKNKEETRARTSTNTGGGYGSCAGGRNGILRAKFGRKIAERRERQKGTAGFADGARMVPLDVSPAKEMPGRQQGRRAAFIFKPSPRKVEGREKSDRRGNALSHEFRDQSLARKETEKKGKKVELADNNSRSKEKEEMCQKQGVISAQR